MIGYARNSVGLRILMAGIPYRDRRAIVESNSVICHEGVRGVNGTSFDSNIIITTTDGFYDLGVWRRPQDAHREVPIQRQRVVTFTDPDISEQSISETEVSTNTEPEPGHLTVMTEEPVAVLMEDRDLADLMEAAHRGRYMGTRSRNTDPLVSLTDASTFDFHATSTQGEVTTDPSEPTVVDRGGSVVTPPMKLCNTKPKNLLAASVKGGVMASLHRSVTGTHQLLSTAVRINAMGGKQKKLHEQLKDPRCAEAWRKEISDLLANGNLVIMSISDVPKGYKAIGYAAAFKHKYNPLTKQYTGTRARLAPHGFRQIQGRDFDPNETAAPALPLEALHVYAMFSATRCRHKRARDVLWAFTSVDLKELIIIEWPVGLPYVEGKCVRLGKMVLV